MNKSRGYLEFKFLVSLPANATILSWNTIIFVVKQPLASVILELVNSIRSCAPVLSF